MLTTESEFFMIFSEQSDNLVQHTTCVNKLNILFYSFSGTTAKPLITAATATTSIKTASKDKQSSQSLLLFCVFANLEKFFYGIVDYYSIYYAKL